MSTDDPLGLVGTTVHEKYAIESVVGEGGFAIVYRAQHTIMKRTVAVKVFKALGEVDPRQRETLLADFNREGALLSELSEKSTAIVQARDVGMLKAGSGETVPFMVLEWLQGRNLEEILGDEVRAGRPPRSLDEALTLLEPVAQALALAHKRGIAHRDVKPANVFVLNDGAGVKLLDFGIAKVVQDAQKMGFGKTSGNVTSFTPLYGAPEQFNRSYGATGPWTDVFALALVVTEVISGKEPMLGDDLVQLAVASANPDLRPTPRSLGAQVSDAVEAVFRKAVAVKTDERYQNAGDFWQALKGAHSGAPVASTFLPDSARTSSGPSAFAETTMSPSVALPPSVASQVAPPLSQSKPASKVPLLIGVVVVAALAVGGALVALRGGGGTGGTDPTRGSQSASASASVAPAPAPAKGGCPEGMVLVPGGSFFMGSDEKDALPFEKPPHKVTLAPYCLDTHEVTVAEFKACSDAGGCRRAKQINEWPDIKPAQRKIYDPLCNANEPASKANHPVNCIDWDQANEYCSAMRTRSDAGPHGRLPTEAEWEFAARGPDGRVYPWGDEQPSAKLLNACGRECVAWQKKNPDPDGQIMAMYDEDDGFPNTAPVGSFPMGKSRYGIHDVVGNVWEWSADWYAEYDKSAAEMVDPKGPAKGKERVIRGGAWNGSQASWVRPSFRFRASPESRSYGIGFRCAKSP